MTMKPKSETDDARASDSNEAELRREKLGVEAAKGVRKALSGNSDKEPVFDTFAGRTGASSALGTPAEGAVEDGKDPVVSRHQPINRPKRDIVAQVASFVGIGDDA